MTYDCAGCARANYSQKPSALSGFFTVTMSAFSGNRDGWCVPLEDPAGPDCGPFPPCRNKIRFDIKINAEASWSLEIVGTDPPLGMFGTVSREIEVNECGKRKEFVYAIVKMEGYIDAFGVYNTRVVQPIVSGGILKLVVSCSECYKMPSAPPIFAADETPDGYENDYTVAQVIEEGA